MEDLSAAHLRQRGPRRGYALQMRGDTACMLGDYEVCWSVPLQNSDVLHPRDRMASLTVVSRADATPPCTHVGAHLE